MRNILIILLAGILLSFSLSFAEDKKPPTPTPLSGQGISANSPASTPAMGGTGNAGMGIIIMPFLQQAVASLKELIPLAETQANSADIVKKAKDVLKSCEDQIALIQKAMGSINPSALGQKPQTPAQQN